MLLEAFSVNESQEGVSLNKRKYFDTYKLHILMMYNGITNMNTKQIAEAISHHQFEKAYEHFSDDITWNMIGGEVIRGKAEVKKICEESATYLATVKTTFTKSKTFVGENFVVIDSSAEYLDDKNEKSIVSSCDIYEFEDTKLVEITSYNIELPQTS